MAEPERAEESNVCVAVKIRPLVASEVDDGCRESLFVTPGLPQVSTGQHTFTYDHVFGGGGTSPDLLYSRCIAPLVAGLFKGYNATVFAYGQTGSGKTFTMGSEYKPGGRCRGVIPDAINDIFTRIEAAKECAIAVRVSFVEIHKEEVKDLLLPASNGPRPAVTIRETPGGEVTLYGAVEKEVRTREEMAEVLELGALCRSTASTQMNNRSSRSHAIFTITIEQRRQVLQQQPSGGATGDGGEEDGDDDDDAAAGDEGDGMDDFLGAKMHLVDLAGSERAKRTKAEGARLREGIHINRGLLALGNVINAIVDNHKHVPYRDSKLTRLLQDSLGGNSRTVMVACVSPADSNHEESLNTLRYADRARHIRNKPVVNRDPVAAQLAALRNTVAQLKSENLALKRALSAEGGSIGRDGGCGLEGSTLESLVERLTQENSSLEQENMRLKLQMEDLRRELAEVSDKWHTAQAQCDVLRMNQAAAAKLVRRASSMGGGGAGDDADGEAIPMPGLDIMKGYLARISELEAENKSLKSLTTHMPFSRRRVHMGEPPRTPSAEHMHGMGSPAPSSTPGDSRATENGAMDDDGTGDQHPELAVEEEYFMELAAHRLDQEKMHKEMAVLQRQLEAKEQKMLQLMKDASSMPALRQHYDRVLAELENERDSLVSERKALVEKLAAVSAASEEERKRIEGTYKERLAHCDERIRELKRKEKEYQAMAKLKQRAEEAHLRLSADISRLKQQKVAMQRQLEAHAKQFQAWQQERRKELTQLQKQGRKDRMTIQHLQAMHAKQSAVLQRKISDANAARRKIKELEEANSRRAASNASAASQQQAAAAAAAQQAMGGSVEMQPNMQAPLLRSEKERRAWLEKELDMCNMSCEYKKVIDGEAAQRAEASRQLKELETRLAVMDQVHPPSPFFMMDGAAILPISPAAAAAASAMGCNTPMGPETRAKLVAQKRQLEEKVAHHSAQIEELQGRWERQKTEEEQRGGGAADVRRWLGLRNLVECRELLRTLFRITVESKSLCNDLTMDYTRTCEDVDVLRVQLNNSHGKIGQYRKLAMSLNAALRRAVADKHHMGMSGQDETDKQVDAVLEELNVVRSRTPTASTRSSLANGPTPEPVAAPPADLVEPMSVCMADAPPEDGDADMMDTETPGRPTAKALEFLSPVPSGAHARMQPAEAAMQRYSDERAEGSDDEADPDQEVVFGQRRQPRGNKARAFLESEDEDESDKRGKARPTRPAQPRNARRAIIEISDDSSSEYGDGDEEEGEGAEDESECSEEEEEEEEEEDDDDDGDRSEDEDWDPKNATPMPKFFARKSCRPSPLRLEPEDDDVLDDTCGASQRRKSKGAGSRRNSILTRSGNSGSGDAEAEHHVLSAINVDRACKGLSAVQKLTVAVLTDTLKGQKIDGQRWCRGNKNRAALIQDCCRLLGIAPASVPEQKRENSWVGGDNQPTGTGRDGAKALNGAISSGTDARPLPQESLESPAARPSDAEGFTFASPHPGKAPQVNSTSTAAVPPAPNAQLPPSPTLTPSGSNRRLNVPSSNLGPWARSSLNATNSSRHFTTWANSLRASCTLPGADVANAEPGPTGAPNLVRSNSIASNGSLSRGSAGNSGGGSVSADGSRRPLGVGSPSNGALRDIRAPLPSPRQSASPRVPGQPTVQTATGATSPRSSMGSPTPVGLSQRASGKSPAGNTQSPSGSRDRSYDGGENMVPGCSTPTATTAGVSGAGKGTPMALMWQEKAAASRERTSALRASMQRAWEQHDPQQARANTGFHGMRASINTFSVAGGSGSIVSGFEGAARAGGLRDSYGAGMGNNNKQQKGIWR